MRRAIPSAILVLAIWCGYKSFGVAPRFEKVSDHCYYLQSKEGENTAAVITEEGVLIMDPPEETDLSFALDALKQTTSKAVRWVVFTDPHFSRTAAARYFAEQGAVILASARLRALSTAAAGAESKDATAGKSDTKDNKLREPSSSAWLLFDRQMRLYSSNVEIRIFAIQQKARTGGDVVVHVPAEKVLFVGNFFEAYRYPDIDTASDGNAAGWIDGLKQVVDSVPVLRPATPQVKPETKPDQEKALEEGIMVVSAHGRVSNLQNMKDLLDASQKLRKDIARAIRAGHSSDSFLSSPGSDTYRSYGNFESYAAQLFEALTAAAERK